MLTYAQARIFALVLVLATVALGVLAIDAARRGDRSHAGAATQAIARVTPGSAAQQRHADRVALGR